MSALVRKCQGYIDRGAALALLVQPDNRSVRLFPPGASPMILRGADQMDCSEIIPGLRFSVDDLFSALRFR